MTIKSVVQTIDLPTLPLTKSEETWLSLAYAKYHNNEPISLNELFSKNLSKFEKGFDPLEVNKDLFASGDILTLYGIYHIDKNSKWFEFCDLLIREIKRTIEQKGSEHLFTSEELADQLDLVPNTISRGARIISDLGNFLAQMNSSEIGPDQFRVDRVEVIRTYNNYENLQLEMEKRYVKRISKQPKQDQSKKEKNYMYWKTKWKSIKDLPASGQALTYIVQEKGIANSEYFVAKVLKNKNRIGRFKQEIKICQSLKHPNIISIKSYELEAKDPYFIMDYCEGGNLTNHDVQNMKPDEILKILLKVCFGINHAHKSNFIHRDIKPENILINKDVFEPIVSDFGLGYSLEDEIQNTATHEIVGSRYYVAPELREGKVEKRHPNQDVYSIGKLLYWMVMGKNIDRENHREKENNISNKLSGPSCDFINNFLDKTIAYEPEKRFQELDTIVTLLDKLIKRIEKGGNTVNIKDPQYCQYCGVGKYHIYGEKLLDPSYTGEERAKIIRQLNVQFGITPSNTIWLVLVCDHCSNVQKFIPKLANKNPHAWRSN